MGKHVAHDELRAVTFLSKDLKDHWWSELPNHVKQGINDSLEQANRGEFISIEEIKIQVSALLINHPRHEHKKIHSQQSAPAGQRLAQNTRLLSRYFRVL